MGAELDLYSPQLEPPEYRPPPPPERTYPSYGRDFQGLVGHSGETNFADYTKLLRQERTYDTPDTQLKSRVPQ